MQQVLIDVADWIARFSGLVVLIAAAIGFMFREKWKQMLQRSLGADLERLRSELAKDHENYKSELAKSQAEHSASLAPQLEKIKHDFERELAAYKVTLIAEAESTKAKQELKKTIALLMLKSSLSAYPQNRFWTSYPWSRDYQNLMFSKGRSKHWVMSGGESLGCRDGAIAQRVILAQGGGSSSFIAMLRVRPKSNVIWPFGIISVNGQTSPMPTTGKRRVAKAFIRMIPTLMETVRRHG